MLGRDVDSGGDSLHFKETKASLEESGDTRYIPGPSNAIVHGTPVKNVYAMIEEIDRYKP